MRVISGVFLGCKYGIPLLRAGGGSIVNTRRSWRSAVSDAQIAYASKGGVLSLTRETASVARAAFASTPSARAGGHAAHGGALSPRAAPPHGATSPSAAWPGPPRSRSRAFLASDDPPSWRRRLTVDSGIWLPTTPE
jgi:hypothetical protein